MQSFALDVTALENTVDVLTFAVEELQQPILESPLKIEDLAATEDEGDLKQFVAVAALVEVLDSLHAARRLLLSGYFSKMLSAIRTMVEALRTADICRDDVAKAREWIRRKEVKKSSRGGLHPTIRRMMRTYDFLSKSGVHPFVYSAITSSLGKPYHEAFRQGGGPQMTGDLQKTIGSLIKYFNESAASFLLYLNEVYPVDWGKDPHLEQKKNRILGLEEPDTPSPPEK